MTEPAVMRHGRELYVRHARKEGLPVAVLRVVDRGAECVVEAEVYPPNATTALPSRLYTFPDSREATAFVTEVGEALMYLGCDVQAS